ncbi:50S ribosomal protein L19 [Candidatus Dojkabacteria bacterium]|uniref:Large ribosomal subunit protein bL19 n=1 Tax=Candidatus Dojkabacteria bacterium TaxID=2099670 RepID=A0A955I745_9BACT|nr:50S ribosomal protein L19 [Candidatus Dojkabacteria bacterium]
MNTAVINKITNSQLRATTPKFKVGDTVEVENIIREGGKQRIQKFKGLVIAIKGSGIARTFTVRKISYGIGVEKTFPLHSPNVAGIKVLKTGNVRRSKIYYMRDRIGKLAMKVKAGGPVVVEENTPEPEAEMEIAPAEETAADATVTEADNATEETSETADVEAKEVANTEAE